MRILNKLKTKIAKFVFVGIAAFAVLGATATCAPQHVHAAEVSETSTTTLTDIIPEYQLQEFIDEAKSVGKFTEVNDHAFIMENAGVTIRCSYVKAETILVGWNYQNTNFFKYKNQAIAYMNKMHLIDGKIHFRTNGYYAKGKLQLYRFTYSVEM